MKLREDAVRWLLQAESDLETARYLKQGRRHDAACFHAQQAGEKALKAFLLAHGVVPPPPHSMVRLLESCASIRRSLRGLDEAARQLDWFYTASRYPNNLPLPEYPAIHFTRKDSAKAIRWAETLVKTIRHYLETEGLLKSEAGS